MTRMVTDDKRREIVHVALKAELRKRKKGKRNNVQKRGKKKDWNASQGGGDF